MYAGDTLSERLRSLCPICILFQEALVTLTARRRGEMHLGWSISIVCMVSSKLDIRGDPLTEVILG